MLGLKHPLWLHPWRYSKPSWAQSWITCFSWLCFQQWDQPRQSPEVFSNFNYSVVLWLTISVWPTPQARVLNNMDRCASLINSQIKFLNQEERRKHGCLPPRKDLFLQPNTDLVKANSVAGLQLNPVWVTLVLTPVVECSLVGTD